MDKIIGLTKTFLITGASSEVGKSFIRLLEKKNETCIIIGLCHSGLKELQELASECEHIRLYPMQCDLSDYSDVIRVMDKIDLEGYEVTHIIHLAAGKFEYTFIKQWDWNNTATEIEIQVHSIMEISKRYLPRMAKKKGGRLVIMLTAYTLGAPPKGVASYMTVKSALLGLMKSLACDYGPKGVHVNGISPSMMETKFLSKVDERVAQMTAQDSMLKRNINLEETCEGIYFLVKDENSYMNGANLNLTGGGYDVGW